MIEMNSWALTHVEVTLWNAAQPRPLGCPRHRSPQPLVAGHHEVTGYAVWICTECGAITPILDEDMRVALGATTVFTPASHAADYLTDPQIRTVPAIPAARPDAGTLFIRHVIAADAESAGIALLLAVAPFGLPFIVFGLVLAPLWASITVSAVSVLIALTAAVAVRRRRTRAAAAELVSMAVTSDAHPLAGQLLVGAWVPTKQLPPEKAAVDRHAARVIQVVRLGATAEIRITTTAGSFTVPDTACIRTVRPEDPGLIDFTYHPGGETR